MFTSPMFELRIGDKPYICPQSRDNMQWCLLSRTSDNKYLVYDFESETFVEINRVQYESFRAVHKSVEILTQTPQAPKLIYP